MGFGVYGLGFRGLGVYASSHCGRSGRDARKDLGGVWGFRGLGFRVWGLGVWEFSKSALCTLLGNCAEVYGKALLNHT